MNGKWNKIDALPSVYLYFSTWIAIGSEHLRSLPGLKGDRMRRSQVDSLGFLFQTEYVAQKDHRHGVVSP